MVFFVLKVENKAWKPGVARPSKSKARWVNTTNKMQVRVFPPTMSFHISFDRWNCIVLNSGLNCSRSEYTEVASEQQRCSQVLQKLLIHNSSSAFRFSDKGTKETEDRAQKWKMWSSTIQVYVQMRAIQGNKQSCEFSIFLGPGKTCWGRGVIRNLSWNWVPEEMAAAKKTIWGTMVGEKKDIWERRFCNSFGEHCILRLFLIAKTWTEHID